MIRSLLTLLCCAALVASDYRFPPGSGIIDVRRDHGAVGDGVADDTDAIQAAITTALRGSRYASPPFIWLAAGTYRITRPLESRDPEVAKGGGWRAGMLLIGESRSHTVVRLADSCPGYGDPATPLPMLRTGSESDPRGPASGAGNRAFLHSLINLTFDSGHGNPGAVGIDWVVSNRGCIEDVTILSGDGAGFCGLRMERSWPGPALVKDVEIRGFDHGLRLATFQYGITIDGLRLSEQRVAGIRNSDNSLWIRRLKSDNRVPAYEAAGRQEGKHAMLVLLDAHLTGGAPGSAALQLAGSRALLRNIHVADYASALASKDTSLSVPTDGRLAQWCSAPGMITGSATDGLALPVAETPVWRSDNPADWAMVTPSTQGKEGDEGEEKKERDDAPAIQAAIDSGKPMVLLSRGSYRIRSTVVLRGAVRLFSGCQSSLTALEGSDFPLLRLADGSAAVVAVEHLRLDLRNPRTPIEHDSARTLVLRHCDLASYRNTARGTGDLFLEDVRGNPLTIAHPQKIWGRQVDCEFGEGPLISTQGADLWLFGFKTEGENTCIRAVGGRVEDLGALIYPLTARKLSAEQPAFDFTDCASSVTVRWNGDLRYPVPLRQR